MDISVNDKTTRDGASSVDIRVDDVPKEDWPISKHEYYGAARFFGMFGGEHVAGTEFVIGATFVMWGVSAFDVLIGLLIGNLFAVLTWAWFTAPIAVETRLSLYSYVSKVSGVSMQKMYNAVNAAFFVINGGAMVTVSASAVREILNLPVQTNWYPTSFSFVLLVLVIGTIVTIVAAYGFDAVSHFSSVCAPWLGVIFVSGALTALYFLVTASDSVTSLRSFSDFMTLANESIWIGDPNSEYSIVHVAAYAWIANLAMHGGLSDMAIFRFAKKKKYGYISAYGMYYGHYIAWICAGIFGAAAILLQTSLPELDSGAVAYQVLGISGIIAVIIAGWTTSNPSLYRAGLAFQTIFNKYSVKTVTLAVGAVSTIIACFPFAFTNLLDVISFMGTIMLPVGAIIVTEHWILPKLGLTRYWSHYKGEKLNRAALFSWMISGAFVILMNVTGWIHGFFVFLPTWILASLLYIFFAMKFGAKESYPKEEERERIVQYKLLKQSNKEAFEKNIGAVAKIKVSSPLITMCNVVAIASLIGLGGAAFMVFLGNLEFSTFNMVATITTVIYFVFATYGQKVKRSLQQEKHDKVQRQLKIEKEESEE